MKRYVYPSKLEGSIQAPPSKSFMQRVIAAALLAEGESLIANPSLCEDSISALSVAEGLGASIMKNSDVVIIKGGINLKSDLLNCGESGLCIRMFTPIAALTGQRVVLTGRGSLTKRPVSRIEEGLMSLGVSIKSNAGLLPIEVSSVLKGGYAEIDGSLSSQFLTGLLMALPAAEKDSVIKVKNLTSKKYIDMTIEVLKDFCIDIENHEYEEFIIKGGQSYKANKIEIEGDWSGAAFMLCAGAIAGDVIISGLNLDSSQPDREIITALKQCGADVNIGKDFVRVSKKNLTGFEFDADDCPDLIPPLAALALHCKGESIIKGAARLKDKESNRGDALKSEFEKLCGIDRGIIRIDNNRMIINGSDIAGGEINSHGDHRIAMACAIACLNSSGRVAIENAECVNKSYNSFFNNLAKLGVKIE
ncbi:MAG: 3-phosphoshikimate 1-carboxyvinyltransferase [Leptospirales bacterium]|nr:3-phosphoshikimate 1-carboxyvinyltransferase [Leptospirales bacterium]